jgi:hypothetical protein
MIKKWFVILCAFLGLSCGSDNSVDLTTRIENELGEALKKFEPTNNAFLFSVFHNDTCIIQIVHRSYVDILRHADNSFGFALNLTFDQTFETEKAYHEKFKQMEVFADFIPYDWDGIPCYAIDLDKDFEKASKLTAKILLDLYGFDEKSKLKLELLDQGRL